MEWIKVEDRLPEEWEEVLAWDGGMIKTAYYYMNTDFDDNGDYQETPNWSYGDSCPMNGVTHWMSHPKPPEK